MAAAAAAAERRCTTAHSLFSQQFPVPPFPSPSFPFPIREVLQKKETNVAHLFFQPRNCGALRKDYIQRIAIALVSNYLHWWAPCTFLGPSFLQRRRGRTRRGRGGGRRGRRRRPGTHRGRTPSSAGSTFCIVMIGFALCNLAKFLLFCLRRSPDHGTVEVVVSVVVVGTIFIFWFFLR